MTPAAFEVFATLLKTRSGLVIGPDKVYLLETRLAALLRAHKLGDLEALALALRGGGNAVLAAAVVEAMTTNETFFFRDDKPFTHFRGQVLPYLAASRPPGAGLRFWSAAASTGQEAYSLAMIAAENQALLGGRRVEIVGTDIAREPLERARAALYTQFEVQRGVPMTALVKHFRKEPDGWRIVEPLRAMVSFREWNLLTDLRPLGQFDTIFCRNVLIYFDQVTKSRVLDAIAERLAPDGVLYLGGAETILGLTERLVTAPGGHGVYQRANAGAASSAVPSGMTPPSFGGALGAIASTMKAINASAAAPTDSRPVSSLRSGAAGAS
jgi:chemotaxis protein methyltransferase CheR